MPKLAIDRNPRVALFVAIVVSADLTGNLMLRAGMRGLTTLPGLAPIAYLQVLLNPWVIVGVLLQIVDLAAQLTLLSWADLSYVVPVTSIGYVLAALAGKLFLHEPLSAPRCAAIVLIMAGVILVTRTQRSTASRECFEGTT
jgi:drug/metabolite transporter (DMT)-like permease